MSTITLAEVDRQLLTEVARYYADPLGFVRFAYPWGKGELMQFTGPDAIQSAILKEIGEEVRKRKFDGRAPVLPIRVAKASGHGVGKTTVAAWLENWIRSTRPDAVGTVTANTWPQLQAKTWAAILRWGKLCITAHWFNFKSMSIEHLQRPQTWKTHAQTCREENSESFAGQHSMTSTSFYIFDESSNIPQAIFDVAEGGLTDGEPMIFLFGNPTRSSGRFYEAVFGRDRNRWLAESIDSRNSKFSNKELIHEWEETEGEDSDFFRVRVKGLPPRASDLQFIDVDRVLEAQKRQVFVLEDEPLIAGIDVARGGMDHNVIRYRRGLDARSIKPVRIPGSQTIDTTTMVSKITMEIDQSIALVEKARSE